MIVFLRFLPLNLFMNLRFFGIGIDIVSIERIARILERSPKFIKTVLSAKELEELQSRQSQLHKSFTSEDKLLEAQKRQTEIFVAKRWAVKEAIFKAIGGRLQLPMSVISILNNSLGMPFLEMSSLEIELREQLSKSSFEELLAKASNFDLRVSDVFSDRQNIENNYDKKRLEEEIISQFSNFSFHLSISDEQQNVVALCIIQKL